MDTGQASNCQHSRKDKPDMARKLPTSVTFQLPSGDNGRGGLFVTMRHGKQTMSMYVLASERAGLEAFLALPSKDAKYEISTNPHGW
jgi:hypothetical protein